jgi:hypothetical protein
MVTLILYELNSDICDPSITNDTISTAYTDRIYPIPQWIFRDYLLGEGV